MHNESPKLTQESDQEAAVLGIGPPGSAENITDEMRQIMEENSRQLEQLLLWSGHG